VPRRARPLGPFGPNVGHAVPLGYPAYAVVPIPADDDSGPLAVIEALLVVLGPFTGDQPVHSGMWEGWGWWYDTGADPRTAPGMGVSIGWPEGEERPAQGVIDCALADAREQLAAERVERPDVELLDLRLIAPGTPKGADGVANLDPGQEPLALVAAVGASEPFPSLTAPFTCEQTACLSQIAARGLHERALWSPPFWAEKWLN